MADQIIPCKYCDHPTRMLGSKMCGGCWDVSSGVRSMKPEALLKLLNEERSDFWLIAPPYKPIFTPKYRRQLFKDWKRDDCSTEDLMYLVDLEVSLEFIAKLSDEQVQDMELWAGSEHLSASDNIVRRLPMPAFLEGLPRWSDAHRNEL